MISTKDLVDLVLAEERAWRQRDQGHTQTGWRSSSLGYCLRKQTYARLGIPEYRDMDAKSLLTFSHGDMYHDWIKRIYRTAGILLVEEGKLRLEGQDLAGHYDALLCGTPKAVEDERDIRWSPAWTVQVMKLRAVISATLATLSDFGPDDVVIDEVKSKNAFGLKRLREEGPDKMHKVQLASYWIMAQADPSQLPAVPTDARLTYLVKDGTILNFGLEDEWVTTAQRNLDQLNEHWAAGTLPPCTCEGWEVSYCDYLLPSARTVVGKPKSNIVGGVDCCPPELFAEAKEGTSSAV